MTTNKVIVSIDNVSSIEALGIIKDLHPYAAGFKFNDILHDGVGIISASKWVTGGCMIMADPKLYDIPNTMKNSYMRFLKKGADIITVHAAASWKANDIKDKSNICGVTVLTSFTDEDFPFDIKIEEAVKMLATKCYDWGYKYIVCSPRELDIVKDIPIKKICPSIRPEWYQEKDDQKRTMTPSEAIDKGADYLVMGRPILNSKDMVEALVKTNEEINN